MKKRGKITKREGINLELFSNNSKLKYKKKIEKCSIFKKELREKQKIKILYNLKEKNLNTIIKKIRNKKNKVKNLIKILETRIENILFRAGIYKTRKEARQRIIHKTIKINNKTISKPSIKVNKLDIIKTKNKNENKKNKFFLIRKNKIKIINIKFYKKYIKTFNSFLISKKLSK